jgi:serine protease Do
LHTHPGLKTSYVLDGEVTIKIDGKADQKMKAGDSFQIPISGKHGCLQRQRARFALRKFYAGGPVPGVRKRRIIASRPQPASGKGEFMRKIRRSFPGWLGVLLTAAVAVLASGTAAFAQNEKVTLGELVSSVVRIKTHINPDGRTVENLGREREGSGIVIDDKDLVLTIGYLMVEAHAAEIITNDGRAVPANIVGYDQETGFGLLQAISPLKVKPLPLGKSADVKDRDPVVVATFGGLDNAGAAYVVSKRQFVGNWEYVVENALFTAPPIANWSGAALISRDGKLVGVGSLIVGDATGKSDRMPGNMFVPIDLLPPILADLIADGRVSGPGRPWLGINADEVHGHLVISRVTPDGPAEKAGLRRRDVILGINGGDQLKNLVDFYQKLWAQGGAGTTIALDVQRETSRMRIDVKSINRLDHLKLKTTF